MSVAEDKEAIREVLYRYCYGTDNGDTELWVEGFTDDCFWDAGEMGVLRGKEAMREFHKPNAASARAMRHYTLNTLIDLQGDRAHVISYVLVIATGEPPTVFFTGFYEDRFVKIDSRWRIKSRLLRPDLADIDAPKPKY